MKASKRFLVTGGCGFIGSHLVDNLIGSGHHVIVIDDLSSGFEENISQLDNVEKFIRARVQDTDLDFAPLDGVFHLAAQASVPWSIENLYLSSTSNLLSTLKVIDFCSRVQCPLVYASSSAVYGDLPLGDEAGGVDLLSPYAADKYMSEIYSKIANLHYGMKSYGLRFFNVYGPRQDPRSQYSGVISIFAHRIINNQPIQINGGYQSRDFIFVGDVVRGLLRAFDYISDHGGAQVSNLLTGSSVTIDHLATLIETLCGACVPRVYKELPAGDPERSLGSMDRMSSHLRLEPFTPLESGLGEVLSWTRRSSG